MAKSANKKADKAQKNAANPKGPESKNDKFLRIALMRMPKVLKSISLVGNLAGSSYESTPEQKEKIVTALKSAVNEVATKLAGTKEESGGGFQF